MKQDRQATGKQLRKDVGRGRLAKLTPQGNERDPLAILEEASRGRLPSLLQLKYKRMAASPFGFFRGAAPVMAYDLSLAEHTGILNQICGDAHLQNLGAFGGTDGRLTFDINDFDETVRAPFEWDVKRMSTSILLAGRDANISNAGTGGAAKLFLKTYCVLMRKLATLPVLDVARYQVHRLGSVAPIARILQAAERSTPLRLQEKLTEAGKKKRRFRAAPPLLRRLPQHEAKQVLSALPLYTESLLPERRHFFAQYRAVDVAFKVVGTGSVGLRDYCVYMEGNGPGDPLFLQVKEEAASAYAPYLAAGKQKQQEGQRVAEGQRAMQLQSDPLLGWTRLDGRDYLVRQLNDHKASITVADLHADSLKQYAGVCGEMLARGHARSGSAAVIAAYVGGGKRFTDAMLTFAEAYVEQTVKDWERLQKTAKKIH